MSVCHVFLPNISPRLPRTRPMTAFKPNDSRAVLSHIATAWNRSSLGRCYAQRQPFDAGSAEQHVARTTVLPITTPKQPKHNQSLQLASAQHNRKVLATRFSVCQAKTFRQKPKQLRQSTRKPPSSLAVTKTGNDPHDPLERYRKEPVESQSIRKKSPPIA